MGGVTHSDLKKALDKHSTEIDKRLVTSLRRLLQEAGFTHSHVSIIHSKGRCNIHKR